MKEGIDYNITPEPLPERKAVTIVERRMVDWKTWLESPQYAAREVKRLDAELDAGDPELFDPEDEMRFNPEKEQNHE